MSTKWVPFGHVLILIPPLLFERSSFETPSRLNCSPTFLSLLLLKDVHASFHEIVAVESSMRQTVIENPIINSPFTEPDKHFRFTDDGITNDIVAGRRSSSYFIPIARPKKQGKQLVLDTEWTEDRIEENRFVNRVRERVKQ